MLNEEDIIREAQRLERLKDLLTALRKRGYDNVICADHAHMWSADDDDVFHVHDEGEEEAHVVRTVDYTCNSCGVKRRRVEIYRLINTTDYPSDPFAELNRAQHKGEEE